MPFYRRRAGEYEPTSSCIGPWDPRVQHGGPPSALLAGAAERFGESPDDFVVVRATVELLRPIGFLPLSVEVTPLRLGRRAQWLQADLSGGGRHLARAMVVRVARASLDLPVGTVPVPAPAMPEAMPKLVFPFFTTDDGYHRSVEIRVAEGVWGEGPCTVWMRPNIPLVDDEPMSPLERVMVLADAGNGVAPALPIDDYAFINPELSVHLRRPLEGEWMALSARSIAEPIGTGLVESRLFDRRGEVGMGLQSLVVGPR